MKRLLSFVLWVVTTLFFLPLAVSLEVVQRLGRGALWLFLFAYVYPPALLFYVGYHVLDVLFLRVQNAWYEHCTRKARVLAERAAQAQAQGRIYGGEIVMVEETGEYPCLINVRRDSRC